MHRVITLHQDDVYAIKEMRDKRLSSLLERSTECMDEALGFDRGSAQHMLWMDLHWAALGLYTDLLLAK